MAIFIMHRAANMQILVKPKQTLILIELNI